MTKDLLFGRRIHGGQRVVEHQDSGIGQQRSRKRDSLSLATRERNSPFADPRVISITEALDVAVYASQRGRSLGLNQLIPRATRPVGSDSEQDVAAHRV